MIRKSFTFSKRLFSASGFTEKPKIRVGGEFRFAFENEREINTVILCEKGSHCTSFSLFGEKTDGERILLYESDVIDKFMYCAFPKAEIKAVILRINQSDNGRAVKINRMDSCLKMRKHGNFRASVYFPIFTDCTFFTDHLEDADLDKAFDYITDAIVIGNSRLRSDTSIDYDEKTLERELAAMRKIIGNRPVRIWCCIFPPAGKTMLSLLENNMSGVVKTIVDYCDKYDFRGIDVDWEHPIFRREWHAFGNLFESLQKALVGRDIQYSAALAPWGMKNDEKFKARLDFINIMAYDWHKANKRRHHAEFFSCHVYCAEYFKKRGFKDNQLFVGIPFYGKTFNNNKFAMQSYNKLNFKSRSQTVDTFEGREYYCNSYNLVYSKAAYNYDMGFGGVMIFAGFDDVPRSTGLSLYEAFERAIADRTLP